MRGGLEEVMIRIRHRTRQNIGVRPETWQWPGKTQIVVSEVFAETKRERLLFFGDGNYKKVEKVSHVKSYL